MAMKYFSMFSGIGGFELGIQRAYELQSKNERLQVETNSGGNNGKLLQRTASCVGYSEIDKYAIKVYERNFNGRRNQGGREQSAEEWQQTQKSELHPESIISTTHNTGGHRNYGDATAIKPEELPDFDLLVGGFPCQAFSIAGKRKGFDDTRGTLFFDIARILAEKKPKHLVLENVKGLLNHEQGRTFQTIIGVLSDLGYRVEWQVLNSKDFRVPQNRERVIIVGHLGAECRGQVFPIGKQSNEYTTLGKSAKATVARTLTAGGHSGGNHSGMTILVKGMLNSEKWQKFNESSRRVYDTSGIAPTIPTVAGGGHTPKIAISEATKKGYAEATVGQAINLSQPNSKTRRGRVSDLAHTIDTGMQQHTLTKEARIRRLTPKECERLQGFPDDWTKYGEDEHGMRVDISDTQRYKMCGNAVTTNVIQAVITNLIECLN